MPYGGTVTARIARERDEALALLREARDMIDHRSFHDRPFQPDTPCCKLEARIDRFLDAR